MKGMFKILLGVMAVALVAAMVAPSALAQCPQAREFGMFGGGMAANKIRIDMSAAGTQNITGLEIGRFWENGVPANTNSGCPSTPEWWVDAGAPQRSIRGFIASPTCTMTVCPGVGASLNVVVEDETADGSNAGFIMFQVDETPASARWWDLERTANAPPGSGTTTIVPFLNFPTVQVVGSVGPPPGTTVTNDYVDIAVNYHGAAGAANTRTPASTGIAAYDIMMSQGAADPGRSRASWMPLKQVNYTDASVSGDVIAVPCSGNPADDTFLAVGIEFVDGVKSALVGEAVAVECDPNLADPEPKIERPNRKNPGRKDLGRGGR